MFSLRLCQAFKICHIGNVIQKIFSPPKADIMDQGPRKDFKSGGVVRKMFQKRTLYLTDSQIWGRGENSPSNEGPVMDKPKNFYSLHSPDDV